MTSVKTILKVSSSRTKGRPPTIAPGPDIRARLVDSARELVAQDGLLGFKVLEVARRAQANVAMINYHFGGRDGLLDEVIRRESLSVASKRAEKLTRLLRNASNAPPSPEEVLRCWLEPMFESVINNREVMMLMVHLMFAADVSQERKTHLLDNALVVTGRYIDVLSQCLPQIPRATLAMRMLCTVGASYVVLGQSEPVGLKQLASVESDAGLPSSRERFQETLAFVLAGVTAPMTPGFTQTPTKPKVLTSKLATRREVGLQRRN